MKWIKITDKLPENEQEVLACHDMMGCKGFDILTYYTKDTVTDYDSDMQIQNSEERLIDSMFNKKNEILAEQDGFYIYDNARGELGYRRHADIITHWAELTPPAE